MGKTDENGLFAYEMYVLFKQYPKYSSDVINHCIRINLNFIDCAALLNIDLFSFPFLFVVVPIHTIFEWSFFVAV